MVAENQQEVHLAVPMTLRRKGAMGDVVHDVSQSSSSSSVVQVGTISKLMDQWRSSTSVKFVLDMKGHYLQHSCHLPLFHNLRWFDIQATPAHHSIVQKEVDELLTKGSVGLSTVGAGFCPNIFVVPKHMGGLTSHTQASAI